VLALPPPPPASDSACDALGMPARAFSPGPYGSGRGELAGDFTVHTTSGDFHLRDAWTGCDVYLFVPDETPFTAGWPIGLWERDVGALLADSPRNVHYFFYSTQPTLAGRAAALNALAGQIFGSVLPTFTKEDIAWWTPRLHLVDQSPAEMGGWLASALPDPGVGLGVDRFQRIRHFGSLSDPTRYSAAAGWFASNLAYVAHEAQYYDFEAARAGALAAEGGVAEVTLFDGELLQGDVYADVLLPEALGWGAFDTLELDLTLGCDGAVEPDACGPWDYIVHLDLCDEADPTVCDVELGRWITTYAREGRWVIDASPLLALLGPGPRRFRFSTGQGYLTTLALRLDHRGRGGTPSEATFLWAGGALDAGYAAAHPPLTVPIPADALRVELYAVISGHGWGAEVANCAEFCDHEHHFTVNGMEWVKDNPLAGTNEGCANRVSEGVVPNQFGTWFFGRGGWCPGLEVAPWVVDVTDAVVPGEDALLTYTALVDGEVYVPEPTGSGQGFGANIDLVSWLVVWR